MAAGVEQAVAGNVLLHLERFRKAVRDWYAGHQRDLPWRRTRDPYHIWVSEVLLQQTRVNQVVPYYERFLEAFPNVAELADASEIEVLKVCEGMGYYARARNLQRAAREVMERHGGCVPDTLEALLALPGVGAYTARAVLSIGYGKSYPVVDGNVKRLLARLTALSGDASASGNLAGLWSLAERLMSPEEPGRFNQAMMELGSLVCAPRKPECRVCPVVHWCLGAASGKPESYPGKPERKVKPHFDVCAGIIMNGGRFLITRRPSEGLLGGLWEFPGGKQEDGETLEACLLREIREELDLEIWVGPAFMSVRHAYSHFRITLHAFLCRVRKGSPKKIGCADLRWVRPDELDAFPFPRADRKIIEKLRGSDPFGLMAESGDGRFLSPAS